MIAVDYKQLQLASAVLRRQSTDHAAAMESYIRGECSLQQADMGLILSVLQPINSALVEVGAQGAIAVREVTGSAADIVDACINDYVEQERNAFEACARISYRLGSGTSNFQDPRSPVSLGPSLESADAGYGAGEPNMFQQAYEQGNQYGKELRSIPGIISNRINGWSEESRPVAERTNPSSYLVPPVGRISEIENLRWSCGPLLGGVDWLFKQLFGFSLIEDVIMKPFTGNWDAIAESAIAWGHVGQSLMEMADNVAGLPEQVGENWRGQAADAFAVAMNALASALVGLSYAADYAGDLVEAVGTVSRLAATTIGTILKQISLHLLAIAAEAAVPVAGWAAAALHGSIVVTKIASALKLVYSTIDLIYDSIYDVIEGYEKFAQVILVAEDINEQFVRGIARSVQS
jgi:uncharacterized protein YukE